MKKDFQPKPLKSLFERNNAWAEIVQTTKLREIEIEVVTKMLACGTTMMGFREYYCENENCTHQKLVCFTWNKIDG